MSADQALCSRPKEGQLRSILMKSLAAQLGAEEAGAALQLPAFLLEAQVAHFPKPLTVPEQDCKQSPVIAVPCWDFFNRWSLLLAPCRTDRDIVPYICPTSLFYLQVLLPSKSFVLPLCFPKIPNSSPLQWRTIMALFSRSSLPSRGGGGWYKGGLTDD